MKYIFAWIIGMVILILMGNFVDIITKGNIDAIWILKISLLYSWLSPLLYYIERKNKSV